MKQIIPIAIGLLIISICLFMPESLEAQCAMCKATAEQGDQRGLNIGILYLFSFPYLIVGTIGFFWWRNRKKNKKQDALSNWDESRLN